MWLALNIHPPNALFPYPQSVTCSRPTHAQIQDTTSNTTSLAENKHHGASICHPKYRIARSRSIIIIRSYQCPIHSGLRQEGYILLAVEFIIHMVTSQPSGWLVTVCRFPCSP